MDFDPRRSDVHPRNLGDAVADHPDDLAEDVVPRGRRPTLATSQLRRWAPLVRRHAIRTADKCGRLVSVAELCEAGLDGLFQALAAANRPSGAESDRELEMAVLTAMRRLLLARLADGG